MHLKSHLLRIPRILLLHFLVRHSLRLPRSLEAAQLPTAIASNQDTPEGGTHSNTTALLDPPVPDIEWYKKSSEDAPLPPIPEDLTKSTYMYDTKLSDSGMSNVISKCKYCRQ